MPSYSDCGSSELGSSADSEDVSHVTPLSEVSELMELISRLHCDDIEPQCDLPDEFVDDIVMGDFLYKPNVSTESSNSPGQMPKRFK